MSSQIHILLAITDSYAAYCAVTLVSLFENNKDNRFCIHIICTDLTKGNKERLEGIFWRYGQEVDWIQPDLTKFQFLMDVKDRMPSKYDISVLYRLFMTEWLPIEINKIIYLDCDLIITRSIVPLWNEPMNSDTALCAAHDIVRINDYHRLKINPMEHIYFNTGVMLINLTYWRSHFIAQRCMDYICTYPERLLLPDQEALNTILAGKVKYIHPQYNTMSIYFAKEEYLSIRTWYGDMEAIREAVKNPVIVHFAGEKPWHKGYYLPYRDEWMKYLAMTEWKSLRIGYKGGWKGRCKLFMQKLMFYILGQMGNTLRLRYPVSPFSKENESYIQ